MNKNTPIALIIADGMGIARAETSNCAITQAHTPNLDKLLLQSEYCTQINTSGKYSGLPNAMMGNSEAGHMAIGCGREIDQIINKVNKEINAGTFSALPDVENAIEKMQKSGGTMHILGILSDDAGAVHGHMNYLSSMAKVFSDADIPVKIHAITDGRDTNPGSAKGFMQQLEKDISDLSNVNIATVSGRYFAMDRDKKWNRIKIAFEAIANGVNSKKIIKVVEGDSPIETTIRNAPSPIEAINQSQIQDDEIYSKLAGNNRPNPDEFILPTVIGDYQGMDLEKDGFFMTNHRPDRAVEISNAICNPLFDSENITETGGKAISFHRSKAIKPIATLGMAAYDPSLNEPQNGNLALMPALFGFEEINNTLSEVLSENGITQLHTAETEKYNHVTKFFNGGKKGKSDGEHWELIPSPDVNSYAEKPEMSAQEVSYIVVGAICNNTHDVIIVNFANPDMVGHTGDLEAAKKAMVQIDKNIGDINDALQQNGSIGILIADHGNAEDMTHTKHTTGPVPFVLFGNESKLKEYKIKDTEGLGLKDVAPTILKLLDIQKPIEMTGESIIINNVS